MPEISKKELVPRFYCAHWASRGWNLQIYLNGDILTNLAPISENGHLLQKSLEKVDVGVTWLKMVFFVKSTTCDRSNLLQMIAKKLNSAANCINLYILQNVYHTKKYRFSLLAELRQYCKI